MNKETPTFEDLVGEEDVTSWKNDIQEGELSLVSALANKQVELAQELASLEEAVKAKKEEFRATSEQELPEAMQAAGLSELVLSTGEKITIAEFYNAHISKVNQETAYNWLVSNGHAGLIKNEVSLKFARDQERIAEETVLALKARGLSPEVRQSVHPSTLKAFVKEQLTSGKDIPSEPFGIYIGSKAIIKKD
jgi:flagellar hook-length control protein FliK|tara:strand:- start:969 stop:1547 length:579 start_codon:yes stop_codon:yes gene_type:complete